MPLGEADTLAGLPTPGAATTLSALARQFACAGTDGLESPEVLQTPDVARAGGVRALRALDNPAAILRESKERLFAASASYHDPSLVGAER